MELRFWGVRGSVAAPGPKSLAVGGNTTCVSLRDDDYLFVFDAGTGLVPLGRYLEDEERSLWQGSIFLSHYHWDHIQGLPFFAPAFRKENRFHMHGEPKKGADLREILAEQMQSPYFPVPMDVQEGLVTFNELSADAKMGFARGISVRTTRLIRPWGLASLQGDTVRHG